MKYILSLFIVLQISTHAFAQLTITVLNEKKQALTFASVYGSNSKNFVFSDATGNASFQRNQDSVYVSYSGYFTQAIETKNLRELTVTLLPNEELLPTISVSPCKSTTSVQWNNIVKTKGTKYFFSFNTNAVSYAVFFSQPQNESFLSIKAVSFFIDDLGAPEHAKKMPYLIQLFSKDSLHFKPGQALTEQIILNTKSMGEQQVVLPSHVAMPDEGFFVAITPIIDAAYQFERKIKTNKLTYYQTRIGTTLEASSGNTACFARHPKTGEWYQITKAPKQIYPNIVIEAIKCR